jgi:hypothetical protein
MKTDKLLIFALVLGMGSGLAAQAQEQTNEVLMTWSATGYTTNSKGNIIATNLTQQTLIDKVAADNGIDPKDCEFVYRVEKLDTAVVWKTNGLFIADVYQMEYTFMDVTNAADTEDYCQSLLNDEYHTNAIGSTFGIKDQHRNSDGYLTSFSYHGTFQCSFPENNVVFTGSFSTGARVYINLQDLAKQNAQWSGPQ